MPNTCISSYSILVKNNSHMFIILKIICQSTFLNDTNIVTTNQKSCLILNPRHSNIYITTLASSNAVPIAQNLSSYVLFFIAPWGLLINNTYFLPTKINNPVIECVVNLSYTSSKSTNVVAPIFSTKYLGNLSKISSTETG